MVARLAGAALLAAAWLHGAWCVRADAPAAQPVDSGQRSVVGRPSALELEDAPEPLAPKVAATVADQAKIEALSLFAAGRMREQNEEYADALRLYQRALQHDPTALPVLERLIDVAEQLGRTGEIARYLKALKIVPNDSARLERLAVMLSERRDFENALWLYEKLLELEGASPKTAPYVQLMAEMGRLYYLNDETDKSAECFFQVLKALEQPDEFGLDDRLRKRLEGEKGRNYELFANVLLAAGRTADARRAYERANTLSPNAALHGYRLAEVLHREKKPRAALRQLQIYFDARETKAGLAAYELLEKLLTDRKRAGELLDRLESLHKDDPANVPLRYFLAEKSRQAGRFDRAEALYADLVKRSPTTVAYRGLVGVYRETGKVKPLVSLLGEVSERSGGLDAVRDEVRQIAADAKLLDQLIEATRRLAASDEGAPRGATLAMALLAIEGKRYEPAGELFELAVLDDPESAAEILLTWGVSMLVGEQYPAAAAIFQRAIDEQVAADNPVFHNYLAIALAMDGKTDRAAGAARKAAELSDHAPRMEIRIPWIYYHAKRYGEAEAEYRRLIDQFDAQHRSEEVREVLREARFALSNICVIQKRLDEAEEWLRQVLDEFPDDVGALNDLGYLWADRGKNLERALDMIQRAVAAEPENRAYLDSLGWVLHRLGRSEEAVAPLQKAAEGEDVDGVILEHLGDVYHALNRHGDAHEAWQRAHEAFKEGDDAEALKRVQEKLKQTAP